MRALVLLGLLLGAGCPADPSPGPPDAARIKGSDATASTPATTATTVEPADASAPKPPPPAKSEGLPATLEEQREVLYRDLAVESDATPEQIAKVRAIIEPTLFIGNGNPKISHHAMTRAECRAVRAGGKDIDDEALHPPCVRKHMVPVFDATDGETAKDARVCIDQFEFPDIPCAYPIVYPTSREAALLCQAVGKRICDAHEWEGACAGSLHFANEEYAFGWPRPYATWLHNKHREIRWAYGKTKDQSLCATGATKSPTCAGGGYKSCGTHTWPAGSFPACVSPFGVYDQHGNAAEHMNLPLSPSELASRGGTGATEMKGSWFIFGREEAHEDDCRWRAKDWHPSALMDEESHRNYHLSFRCCSDVADASGTTPDAGEP